MTDIEAGWVMLGVSCIAWIAWWVGDYVSARKMNDEQWRDWPGRSRIVRSNFKVSR